MRYITELKSGAALTALQDYARAKGVGVYEDYLPKDLKDYPYVLFDTPDRANKNGYLSGTRSLHDAEVISLEVMYEKIHESEPYRAVSVELNGEYTAEVVGDVVHVGCQRIPVEKVKELYHKIMGLQEDPVLKKEKPILPAGAYIEITGNDSAHRLEIGHTYQIDRYSHNLELDDGSTTRVYYVKDFKQPYGEWLVRDVDFNLIKQKRGL